MTKKSKKDNVKPVTITFDQATEIEEEITAIIERSSDDNEGDYKILRQILKSVKAPAALRDRVMGFVDSVRDDMNVVTNDSNYGYRDCYETVVEGFQALDKCLNSAFKVEGKKKYKFRVG